MMPCRYCGPRSRKGLKQFKAVKDGTHVRRDFRCRDCGATMRRETDLRDPLTEKEEWRPARFVYSLRRTRDGYAWKVSPAGC